MRFLKLSIIFICGVVCLLFSCAREQEEKVKNNEEPYELLIEREELQTELLWANISHVSNAYILVSNGFTDTVSWFKEVKIKFQNLLLDVQNYSESLDEGLLVDIENEYFTLLEYLSSYQNKLMLTDSFKETREVLDKSFDTDLKRLVMKQFYNDLLSQRLSIIQFKYDSLLFECHDSLVKYDLKPYSNTFIITESISDTL